MKRKEFIRNSALAGGSLFLLSCFDNTSSLFTSEEIDEFVGVAHHDFELTNKILKAKPLILNCASQMAKGDFETAMGGASHMGRKDIVELLLGYGSRMDIFSLTFLGYSSTVKSLIKKHPSLIQSYGPHGYTLLHHAKIGKHKDLENWIRDQGLDKEIFDNMFPF